MKDNKVLREDYGFRYSTSDCYPPVVVCTKFVRPPFGKEVFVHHFGEWKKASLYSDIFFEEKIIPLDPSDPDYEEGYFTYDVERLNPHPKDWEWEIDGLGRVKTLIKYWCILPELPFDQPDLWE